MQPWLPHTQAAGQQGCALCRRRCRSPSCPLAQGWVPPKRASALLLANTAFICLLCLPSPLSHLMQLVVKYLAQQPGGGVLTPMGNKLTPR